MRLSKFLTATLLFLSCLSINCSNLLSKKKVSSRQIQNFHQQLIDENWKQIYDEGSFELKSRLSEQDFRELIKKADAKMRTVDETLDFKESEMDVLMSQIMDVEYQYSVKTEKLEKNGNRLEIITHWNKNGKEDVFRLAGFVLLENANSGKPAAFYI